METLKFDLSVKGPKFKLLNATNGGPWYKVNKRRSTRITNLEDYKAARIPYSRNHDSAHCGVYGAPYAHDVSRIFPDFSADPYDPESYDFECTDDAIIATLEAGTKTFFRLGECGEINQKIRYLYDAPSDPKKWATICEHIIAHYNEGWANGYHFNMDYWEIWNEPNLGTEDAEYQPFWMGTKEQFYDLYCTTAIQLKERFPYIKIGGPSTCANKYPWLDGFFAEVKRRNAPLDFFSWHSYCTDVYAIERLSNRYRKLLDDNGFEKTESILNEWNYMEDFSANWKISLERIRSIKGASHNMSVICMAQNSTIDMLMYYDTKPSVYNGVFDFYTHNKLKGYYPLYWYGMFYDMEYSVKAQESIQNIFSLCGVDKDGKVMAVLTHYSPENEGENKKIKLDIGRTGKFEVYLLDDEHDATLIGTTDNLEFDMKLHSAVLIKEI